MHASIRIFVIAPVRCYRDALASAIESQPGYVVAGTASDAAGFRDARADVVLVDLARRDELDAIRAAGARIVGLGVPDTEPEAIACAEAGVVGYVSPDASIADLLATVRRVSAGEVECPSSVVAAMFRRLTALAAEERHTQGQLARLTARETEILRLIDEGLSNKEIARRLQIEIPTVKNHVHHILEKLRVHRRGEAAARARRSQDPVPRERSMGLS